MPHSVVTVFKEFIEDTKTHDVIAAYQCESCSRMLLLKIGNKHQKGFDVNSFNIKVGADMAKVLHEREIL